MNAGLLYLCEQKGIYLQGLLYCPLQSTFMLALEKKNILFNEMGEGLVCKVQVQFKRRVTAQELIRWGAFKSLETILKWHS